MRLEPPAFWYGAPGIAAFALSPAAAIYGLAVQARFKLASPYRSALPVLCVGNFTLGGAGKTPAALELVRLLRGRGLRPAVLTRGYGGSEAGPRSVTEDDTAVVVGDEALLLAKATPTVVSRNRPAGARLIEAMGADVIVMDDGFQNPSLQKDFNLVVVDGGSGLGSGRTFPAGPLRAPLNFQLDRASAILILRAGPAHERLTAKFGTRPIVEAEIAPVSSEALAGRRFVAFCGIGRPAKFEETLTKANADVRRFVSFPDHHRYNESEASSLLDAARQESAELVTTEKDYVRLGGDTGPLRDLREASMPLRITLRFIGDGEARLLHLIEPLLPPRASVARAR
jgi:tetraacyldisaccharide 4'-kinase